MAFVTGADFQAAMSAYFMQVPVPDTSELVQISVDRDFAPELCEMAAEYAEACERHARLARDLVARLVAEFPGVGGVDV